VHPVLSLPREVQFELAPSCNTADPDHVRTALFEDMYTVSGKNRAKMFLSQVRQMSTNFDNFWHTDSTKDRFMRGALIFQLT